MYKKKGHIHFVGIGGIGMSGIAKILKQQGYRISGCDKDIEQQSITELQKLGCDIYHGNNTITCNDESIDILVYSSAINPNNPEIKTAQNRNIPTISRARMLAELMRTKYSIAISGAHGKTTTTSLISHILIEAAYDPTVIIGGHVKNISTNARHGSGDFLVAEADESDRSFLSLHATLAVITNIDLEHLETYKDINDIVATFGQFLNNLPFYGKAFVYGDDPYIQQLIDKMQHIKIVKFGFTANCDVWADNIILNADHSIFDVIANRTALGTLRINMPGIHNVANALAAITVALDLSVPYATIARSLNTFGGIERRFMYKGCYRQAELFDDYGHHPKEIDYTLQVARKRTRGRLIVIFQPHRFTRTQKLWDQFILTFIQNTIDYLIITDIYPASEEPLPYVNSQILVTAIKKCNPHFEVWYIPYDKDFDLLMQHINIVIQPDDLVLFLGAGIINRMIPLLNCPEVTVKPHEQL